MEQNVNWITDSDQHALRRHPLYQEGMAHLQAGAWDKAIHCFQELARIAPDDAQVARLLHQAQLKATVDAGARVKAKRWIIPWKRLIVYFLIASATLLAVMLGGRLLRQQVAPVLAEAQSERRQTQLLEEASSYMSAGQFDEAEARYQALLAEVPDHEGAQKGLAYIQQQRVQLALYEEAVALQEQGEYEAALAKFTELSLLAPRYRDVGQRVTAIKQQQALMGLLAEAETAYQEGLFSQALAQYEQIRARDVNYQASLVSERLFTLYLELGRELVERRPPELEQLPKALDYLTRALSLQPRNAEAELEQRLLQRFLEGQRRYYEGYWNDAIAQLRPVYDQRPDYLDGIGTEMLYDAYIHSGDDYRASDDLQFAYEQYRRATELPVADRTLALGRLQDVAPFLTPTPTPTATPTPTNTPMPTPTGRPTAVPTPRPLASYHNEIIFFSKNEDQPGLWVMDPDGQNRRYLGNGRALLKEYQALVEESRYSPDHQYYLFVRSVANSAQIFYRAVEKDASGNVRERKLTDLKVCYDPVWSPDGSRILFVSEQDQSDDIWIMNADGSGARNLTLNIWEWDKHPSWSPDGSRLVFWSNREGHAQIWVMDPEGRNARNISQSEWEEYDPIWVK